MAQYTSIEWTGCTWNPVTGCTKISPGCKNCYAERMAKRLQAMGQHNYRNGFKVQTHELVLTYPLKWKKPRTIFVNSMSDMFHDDVPDEFIFQIFEIMHRTPHHLYQILTKRPERLLNMNPRLKWTDNIWMGVSVENQNYTSRIDLLRQTDARIIFLSIEPLIGLINSIDLSGIDWVIVGGESGPGAREMKEEWVIKIRDMCIQEKVPFFFKQWGGINKKKNGRLLEGKIWNQAPGLDNDLFK